MTERPAAAEGYVSRRATEEALERLEKAVRRGMPAVLAGPAGSGKSLLLACLADRLAPYQEVQRLPEAALSFAELAGWLCERLGGTPGPRPGARLLALATERAMADRPVVVLLDDAGAGPDGVETARLLAELAGRSAGALGVVVAAAEGVPAGQLAAACGRGTIEVSLAAPLDLPELRAWVEARIERAGLPEPVRARFDAATLERLLAASGGNPALAATLVHGIVVAGRVPERRLEAPPLAPLLRLPIARPRPTERGRVPDSKPVPRWIQLLALLVAAGVGLGLLFALASDAPEHF